MHIEQLEPAQAEQDLKGLLEPFYGSYYGIGFRVAEDYPDVYFVLTDGDKKFYFRSDFETWQNYTNADLVSKCMEIANL